MQTEDPLMCSR